MKKLSILLSLALSLAFLLPACAGATPVPAAILPTAAPDTVIAEGHLVPNQSLYLSFMASGRVQELLVKKGDQVSQGQVLARLADREQVQAALAGAQVQLLAAQQTLELLTRTSGLAHAQAWQAWMSTQKVRAAAQLALDKLDQDSLQTDIHNAQADVTSRRTDLENAQKDFNKYSSLPAENSTRKSYADKLRTAQTNYDTAVQKAEELVNRRDNLQAALNADLASEAEAKRSYESTQAGPDPDKLALAQAQLEAAHALVASARIALEYFDLKAPFAGTVADTNVSLQQPVTPQTWVIALADTRQWYVDTSDLTEMDVVRVSLGQSVQVTADALPGMAMTGVVESLSTAPKTQGGDIVYTVRIRLNDPDPALLWGMTMEVTFTP
jgi:multidrug resistance efflux pump